MLFDAHCNRNFFFDGDEVFDIPWSNKPRPFVLIFQIGNKFALQTVEMIPVIFQITEQTSDFVVVHNLSRFYWFMGPKVGQMRIYRLKIELR
jgi:hypothetical protein